MNSRERAKANRDLERCVARLLKLGWTLDALETCDERNEDYQAVIRVSIAGYDREERGVI